MLARFWDLRRCQGDILMCVISILLLSAKFCLILAVEKSGFCIYGKETTGHLVSNGCFASVLSRCVLSQQRFGSMDLGQSHQFNLRASASRSFVCVWIVDAVLISQYANSVMSSYLQQISSMYNFALPWIFRYKSAKLIAVVLQFCKGWCQGRCSYHPASEEGLCR